MVETKKCLDTYALIEIIKENPKFAHYLNVDFVVADTTLAEFYWILLREYGAEAAEYWYRKLEQYTVAAELTLLIEAMAFRFEHRKQIFHSSTLQVTSLRLKHGYPLVTGDKEFENFEGVEFRKK